VPPVITTPRDAERRFIQCNGTSDFFRKRENSVASNDEQMKLGQDGVLRILLLAFHYPFLLCSVKFFIRLKQKKR
jgi:hypothetical protein